MYNFIAFHQQNILIIVPPYRFHTPPTCLFTKLIALMFTLSLQINPVHQLFPLDGDTCEADADVIFFHGSQQHPGDQSWKTSWVQRGKSKVCWPQEWLPGDLRGRVRVLLLEYDAQITEFGGRGNTEDVHDIALNLIQTLVNR